MSHVSAFCVRICCCNVLACLQCAVCSVAGVLACCSCQLPLLAGTAAAACFGVLLCSCFSLLRALSACAAPSLASPATPACLLAQHRASGSIAQVAEPRAARASLGWRFLNNLLRRAHWHWIGAGWAARRARGTARSPSTTTQHVCANLASGQQMAVAKSWGAPTLRSKSAKWPAKGSRSTTASYHLSLPHHCTERESENLSPSKLPGTLGLGPGRSSSLGAWVTYPNFGTYTFLRRFRCCAVLITFPAAIVTSAAARGVPASLSYGLACADHFQIARDRHVVRWAASTRQASLRRELRQRGRPQVRPRHKAISVAHNIVHRAVKAAVERGQAGLAYGCIRAKQPAREGVGLENCVWVLSAGCVTTLHRVTPLTTPAAPPTAASLVSTAAPTPLPKSRAVTVATVATPPVAPSSAVPVPPRLPQAPIPKRLGPKRLRNRTAAQVGVHERAWHAIEVTAQNWRGSVRYT
jgi:hypothetical protein